MLNPQYNLLLQGQQHYENNAMMQANHLAMANMAYFEKSIETTANVQNALMSNILQRHKRMMETLQK